MGFDVQGGGSDLAFPHHEMGASHAQALTGEFPMAKAYVHAGMVALDGEKMSKSKGNLVFVSKLRRDGVDPAAIRLAPPRAPLPRRLGVDGHRPHGRGRPSGELAGGGVASRRLSAEALVEEICEALANDLDAPAALAAVDRWAALQRETGGTDEGAPGVVACRTPSWAWPCSSPCTCGRRAVVPPGASSDLSERHLLHDDGLYGAAVGVVEADDLLPVGEGLLDLVVGDLVGVHQGAPGVVDEQVEDRRLARERGDHVPEVLGDPARQDLRLLLLLPAELLEQLLERLLLPHLLRSCCWRCCGICCCGSARSRVLVQRVRPLRVLDVGFCSCGFCSWPNGCCICCPNAMGCCCPNCWAAPCWFLLPQLDALLDALLVSLLLTHLRGGAHTGATFRESSNR